MSAIFKREFKNSMQTMTGAIFIAYVLLWFGVYTAYYNLNYGVSDFAFTTASVSFISLLAVPILTMRSFSEERHNGTDKLLYSLPVKTAPIVLAKYFACVAVFAIPTLVISLYPFILAQFGAVYLNTAYSTVIAYFLLGCALIAIGNFISSLTESQVISAILSLGTILLLYFISSLSAKIPQTKTFSLIVLLAVSALVALVTWVLTKNPVATGIVFLILAGATVIFYIINGEAFEGLVSNCLKSLDMFAKTERFYEGVLDVKAIVYYLSVTVFFLFLTVQSVEKRRWN